MVARRRAAALAERYAPTLVLGVGGLVFLPFNVGVALLLWIVALLDVVANEE